MEGLSLDPLRLVVDRLELGLARSLQNPSDDQLRDGLIQRFEFTYELAHRTLKRYLELSSPSQESLDQLNFQDLIRSANEQGLLSGDWIDWKEYRSMRSRTSHAYGVEMALSVVEGIPKFLAEAQFLLNQLVQRTTHG